MRTRYLLIGSLAVALIASFPQAAPTRAAPTADVRALQLLTPTSGWALTGGELLRTDDAGNTWRSITPIGASGAALLAASFLDPQRGWVIEAGPQLNDPPGSTVLYAHRTLDGGLTWLRSIVGSTSYGRPGRTALAFGDALRGLLVISLEGSIALGPSENFSTINGGLTWTEGDSPARGEPKVDASMWIAGGRGGAFELFRSSDQGLTWSAASLQANPSRGRTVVGQPRFFGPVGVVAAAWTSDSAPAIGAYVSTNGGATWTLAFEHATPEPVTVGIPIASAVVDESTWILVTPSAERLLRVTDSGRRVEVVRPRGLPAGVLRISFASGGDGWALRVTEGPGRIFATADGGRSWKDITP